MQKKEVTKCSTNNELGKILTTPTQCNYIEENKLVLFNIVDKKKFDSNIEGIRTSIGYILPTDEVYDFVSKTIYPIYKLYKNGNFEKEGEFALITNIIFKSSTNKYLVTDENLNKLDILLEKYVNEYNSGKAKLREYSIQIQYNKNNQKVQKKRKTIKLK